MAQKRMFDKKVVGSDKFLDLPNSSKALYFMAGMEADDKGFFQPRKLQKMCGFSDDDYKILIAKSFFITFESGVMVVTDWNKNNWLDSRRITETEYVDELNLLKLVNQKYEFRLEKESAKPMLSQYSIEENRIEENSIEKKEIKRKNFVKPTIEEIAEYCKERNNGINANAFYDFYESKDWYVGKNRMKDWKACVRTWEQRLPKKESVPDWFNKELKNEPVSEKDEREMEELLKELEENISEIKG